MSLTQSMRRRPDVCAHQRRYFAVLPILALASGCGRSQPNSAPVQQPPPAVTVARPVQREVVEWDEYSGYLEAVDFVEVRARVSGMVVNVPFQAGSVVKQGDLLVEIDVRPFQAELDSRLAEEARATAQVKLAEIELQRIQELPSGASVPIELQRVEASLAEARAIQAAARAAVEAARLHVEWCRVTAPISGRSSSRYVDAGNLITGGGGTGTLLTTIASIDPMYCWIDADERAVLKYQRLAREQKRVSARDAQIPFFMQLADETTFSRRGYVDFVDNRIDPATGTIRGRGVIDNAGGFLTPGFFARVRIPGSGTYVATLIPDAAVQADQNQRVVYILDSENTVQLRQVQLGALFGKLRAIAEGLQGDDRVVINGFMQGRPGMKVIPTEIAVPTDTLPPIPADATTPRQLNGTAAGGWSSP